MSRLWRMNAMRPNTGSVLQRWLAGRAPHPDAFDCGVRVITGSVPGERSRWTFRTSAVDPFVQDGIITLRHGQTQLRLVIDDVTPDDLAPHAARPAHVIVPATEHDTQARVQVSVGLGELNRFGVETPL